MTLEAVFLKYSYLQVCRQEGLAADCLGKFSNTQVCREIPETDLDTWSKPEYQSTLNTGAGSFPGILLDSCT